MVNKFNLLWSPVIFCWSGKVLKHTPSKLYCCYTLLQCDRAFILFIPEVVLTVVYLFIHSVSSRQLFVCGEAPQSAGRPRNVPCTNEPHNCAPTRPSAPSYGYTSRNCCHHSAPVFTLISFPQNWRHKFRKSSLRRKEGVRVHSIHVQHERFLSAFITKGFACINKYCH